MPIQRQQVPVFSDYKTYKRYLRIDFNYRCAYCGVTEYRWGSERNFVVEHFRPQRWFPELTTFYANLYYACNRCNDIKSDRWPTAEETELKFGWIDPCESDFADHFEKEAPDGILQPTTQAGRYTVENLQLNLRNYLVEMRRERKQLLDEILATEKLVKRIEDTATEPDLVEALRDHLELCQLLLSRY